MHSITYVDGNIPNEKWRKIDRTVPLVRVCSVEVLQLLSMYYSIPFFFPYMKSEIRTWHVQPSKYKAQDSTKGIIDSNENYHMTTRVTIKQSNRLVTIVNEDWGHSLDGILLSPKEACTTQGDTQAHCCPCGTGHKLLKSQYKDCCNRKFSQLPGCPWLPPWPIRRLAIVDPFVQHCCA